MNRIVRAWSLGSVVLVLGLGLFGTATAADDVEITGEVRIREEANLNFDFDSDTGNPDNFALLRTRIGLSARTGEVGSVFVQFQDSRALGEPNSTITNLEQVDMHQAYFQVDEAFNAPLRLRLGRQEMTYGRHRLVGDLNWNNTGRAFDGVQLRYDIENFGWFDVFAHKIMETGGIAPGVNDGANASGEEQAFFGAYLHYDLQEATAFEAYVFDLYTDQGDLPSGDDRVGNLFTAGGRFEHASASGNLKLRGEGAVQFGEEPDQLVDGDGRDILAWAATGTIAYRFESSARPWIAAEANLASGDDGTDPTEIDTFNQLFPTSHGVLGYMDFVGWQNIIDLQGTLGVAPNDQWKLWGSYHYFQLLEAADNWYDAAGRVRLSGDPSYDDQLGMEIDITARYTPEENLSFEANYSIWIPGDWQEQATAGSATNPLDLDPAHWVYVMGTASF